MFTGWSRVFVCSCVRMLGNLRTVPQLVCYAGNVQWFVRLLGECVRWRVFLFAFARKFTGIVPTHGLAYVRLLENGWYVPVVMDVPVRLLGELCKEHQRLIVPTAYARNVRGELLVCACVAVLSRNLCVC